MSIREAGAGPMAPTVLVPEATCVRPASLILSATIPASLAFANRSFLKGKILRLNASFLQFLL